jgi:hypothetical protein
MGRTCLAWGEPSGRNTRRTRECSNSSRGSRGTDVARPREHPTATPHHARSGLTRSIVNGASVEIAAPHTSQRRPLLSKVRPLRPPTRKSRCGVKNGRRLRSSLVRIEHGNALAAYRTEVHQSCGAAAVGVPPPDGTSKDGAEEAYMAPHARMGGFFNARRTSRCMRSRTLSPVPAAGSGASRADAEDSAARTVDAPRTPAGATTAPFRTWRRDTR